jgi:ABC-type sugar transport system permease subunit
MVRKLAPYSATHADGCPAYHNDLRARSLLAFMAVVLQIPCGLGLQRILDHKTWSRKKRGLIGLTVVAVPLVAAWIWEMVSLPFLCRTATKTDTKKIRVKGYHRHHPRTNPTDWSDPEFGWIFLLFMLTWISCVSSKPAGLSFSSALLISEFSLSGNT